MEIPVFEQMGPIASSDVDGSRGVGVLEAPRFLEVGVRVAGADVDVTVFVIVALGVEVIVGF
jgi:hypothetical protein